MTFPAGVYLHTIIFEGCPKIVPARQLAMAQATCLLPFHTTYTEHLIHHLLHRKAERWRTHLGEVAGGGGEARVVVVVFGLGRDGGVSYAIYRILKGNTLTSFVHPVLEAVVESVRVTGASGLSSMYQNSRTSSFARKSPKPSFGRTKFSPYFPFPWLS